MLFNVHNENSTHLSYLKLEKSSGLSSKYLMSLILIFPTILFLGPSTTGRPPIWLSLICLKASNINSLLWMLITWPKRETTIKVRKFYKLKSAIINTCLVTRHERKSQIRNWSCSYTVKPVPSSTPFKTLNYCRLSYVILDVRFPWFNDRYIPQSIFWK